MHFLWNILENYHFKSIFMCSGEFFEFTLWLVTVFYSLFQLKMDWSICIICQKEDSELGYPINESSVILVKYMLKFLKNLFEFWNLGKLTINLFQKVLKKWCNHYKEIMKGNQFCFQKKQNSLKWNFS